MGFGAELKDFQKGFETGFSMGDKQNARADEMASRQGYRSRQDMADAEKFRQNDNPGVSTNPATPRVPTASDGSDASASTGGVRSDGRKATTDDPMANQILDTIRPLEGGTKDPYNTGFGGKKIPIEQMTVNDVLASGYNGLKFKVLGAYQFKDSTLRGLVEKGYVDGSQKFDANTQDNAALQLMKARGYDQFKQDPKGQLIPFMHNLSMEWASLPDPTKGGASHYSNGTDHAGISLPAFQSVLHANPPPAGQNYTGMDNNGKKIPGWVKPADAEPDPAAAAPAAAASTDPGNMPETAIPDAAPVAAPQVAAASIPQPPPRPDEADDVEYGQNGYTAYAPDQQDAQGNGVDYTSGGMNQGGVVKSFADGGATAPAGGTRVFTQAIPTDGAAPSAASTWRPRQIGDPSTAAPVVNPSAGAQQRFRDMLAANAKPAVTPVDPSPFSHQSYIEAQNAYLAQQPQPSNQYAIPVGVNMNSKGTVQQPQLNIQQPRSFMTEAQWQAQQPGYSDWYQQTFGKAASDDPSLGAWNVKPLIPAQGGNALAYTAQNRIVQQNQAWLQKYMGGTGFKDGGMVKAKGYADGGAVNNDDDWYTKTYGYPPPAAETAIPAGDPAGGAIMQTQPPADPMASMVPSDATLDADAGKAPPAPAPAPSTYKGAALTEMDASENKRHEGTAIPAGGSADTKKDQAEAHKRLMARDKAYIDRKPDPSVTGASQSRDAQVAAQGPKPTAPPGESTVDRIHDTMHQVMVPQRDAPAADLPPDTRGPLSTPSAIPDNPAYAQTGSVAPTPSAIPPSVVPPDQRAALSTPAPIPDNPAYAQNPSGAPTPLPNGSAPSIAAGAPTAIRQQGLPQGVAPPDNTAYAQNGSGAPTPLMAGSAAPGAPTAIPTAQSNVPLPPPRPPELDATPPTSAPAPAGVNPAVSYNPRTPNGAAQPSAIPTDGSPMPTAGSNVPLPPPRPAGIDSANDNGPKPIVKPGKIAGHPPSLVPKADITRATDGGLKYIAKQLQSPVKSVAIGPDQRQQDDTGRRANLLVRNAGALAPSEYNQLSQQVDPENKLAPAEKILKVQQDMFDYYMAKGYPDKAMAASASVLLYGRRVSQLSGSMATVALQHGDINQAAAWMAKAYETLPDGQELRVGKADAQGNVQYQLVDLDTGEAGDVRTASPDDLTTMAKSMSSGMEWARQTTAVGQGLGFGVNGGVRGAGGRRGGGYAAGATAQNTAARAALSRQVQAAGDAYKANPSDETKSAFDTASANALSGGVSVGAVNAFKTLYGFGKGQSSASERTDAAANEALKGKIAGKSPGEAALITADDYFQRRLAANKSAATDKGLDSIDGLDPAVQGLITSEGPQFGRANRLAGGVAASTLNAIINADPKGYGFTSDGKLTGTGFDPVYVSRNMVAKIIALQKQLLAAKAG